MHERLRVILQTFLPFSSFFSPSLSPLRASAPFSAAFFIFKGGGNPSWLDVQSSSLSEKKILLSLRETKYLLCGILL